MIKSLLLKIKIAVFYTIAAGVCIILVIATLSISVAIYSFVSNLLAVLSIIAIIIIFSFIMFYTFRSN